MGYLYFSQGLLDRPWELYFVEADVLHYLHMA